MKSQRRRPAKPSAPTLATNATPVAALASAPDEQVPFSNEAAKAALAPTMPEKPGGVLQTLTEEEQSARREAKSSDGSDAELMSLHPGTKEELEAARAAGNEERIEQIRSRIEEIREALAG